MSCKYEDCRELSDIYCYAKNVPQTGNNVFYNIREDATLHVPSTSIEEYKAIEPWSRFAKIVAIEDKADIVEINGIYYDLEYINDGKLEVTCNPNFYTGEIVIPKTIEYKGNHYNVTGIGHSAFEDCSSLTSITIPNGVTEVGPWAFYKCSSLSSVTIPNTATEIGDYAFYDCSSLSSVTIPNSVTEIGYYAFSGCSSLLSVTIPNSVTFIGSSAFSGCHSLTSVYIPPRSVTSIGSGTFSGCYSLTSVYIPTSVTSIGSRAFSMCSSLTSVNIPNSVTKIGDYAFEKCGLTSVNIPNSLISIGRQAFHDCYDISSIVVASENPVYDSRDNCNAIIGTATNTLIFGCPSTQIPNSVTEIAEGAFEACYGLTSITIPNSITTIPNYAFNNCTNLTSVTIPNNLTSIGYAAFGSCASLTSITIPNSVSSIGDYAFYGCEELCDIYCYAKKVPQTGDNVFERRNMKYTTTLHVPSASLEEYKTTEPWSNFVNIVDLESTSINGIPSDGKPFDVYDLQGYKVRTATNSLSNLPKGVYIVNTRKVIIR